MPTECCVPGCTNRENRHKFPWSEQSRFRQWVAAIRRDKWAGPKKYTVVCSRHFTPDDYLSKTVYGTSPLQKKLKPTAIPSVFPWSRVPTEADLARSERCIRRDVQGLLSDLTLQVERQLEAELALTMGIETKLEIFTENTVNNDEASLPVRCTGAATQTDHPPIQDTGVQTSDSSLRASFSIFNSVNDNKGLHFYTGLETYEKLCFVLNTLFPASHHLNYYLGFTPSLCVADQFFIALIKLRQNKTNFELSRMFNVSEACITNIFITWVNFMYMHWKEQPWWPCQDVVRYFSPTDFRRKYPTTRCIIDGTECPIQKPRQPIAQQATYSTYKNRNTIKVLIGASPGGLVNCVTDAYGGSASDRQIVERSSIPQSCDPGDSVMADKGFNVQDLFVPHDVVINIPTFFSKKNRMSCETVIKDRRIASKRVHIERIIGLGKTYKVLTSPMGNTESAMASRIVFVCYTLANFRNCIVPKNA